MKFGDFFVNGKVRRASSDPSLAKSLINNALADLKFLEKLSIDIDSARKIMTNYYDIIRSLLEAIAILEGYKIYSHEAFTFFLLEKHEDVLAAKFDRFRKIRNGINYYGKTIEPEEVHAICDDIKMAINYLLKKYLSEL